MKNCGIKSFTALFSGLTHTKNLKKLDLSYNHTTIQQQNINKIRQFFKHNKCITQLRLKFTGYNQLIFTQIFTSLQSNTTLSHLDISENHLSDNGGKQILRLLNINKSLQCINLQKLQLTIKMRQQINKFIEFNNDERKIKENQRIVQENMLIKQKANQYTWKDVGNMYDEGKNLQNKINQAIKKNQKIMIKIQNKRESIIIIKKQLKQQERKRNLEIKKEENIINQRIKLLQLQIKNVNQNQIKMIEQLQIQKNLINMLQTKIQKQNQKIKKRQNQLQNLLQNAKYMNKKNKKQQYKQKDKIIQKMNENNRKQSFDNTKSMLSMKKSSIRGSSGKKTYENK